MIEQIILSQYQLENIKNRYPEFELSYESMLHNKVPEKYNLAFAIPLGKKCIAWFTFFNDKNVVLLMELNKEKRIVNAKIMPCIFDEKLCINTLIYGVYFSEYNIFMIEDIHYYKGIKISKLNLKSKFHYIQNVLNVIEKKNDHLLFSLPVFWEYKENSDIIPKDILNTIPYQIHHIQYKSLNEIVPYLNSNYNKLEKVEKSKLDMPIYIPIKQDFKKPQFKLPTIFLVKADIQFDIYRLFVYGKSNSKIYYNTAFIPDYKTSVFMNKIFRKIKENDNLDYIEESDDEEDFQNIEQDKYVDMNKEVQMECTFNYKFKRWIPNKIVYNRKIIHISQLQYFNK